MKKRKVSFMVSEQTFEIFQRWIVSQGHPFAEHRIDGIFARALETDSAQNPFAVLKKVGKNVLFNFVEKVAIDAKRDTLKQIPPKN